MARGRVVDRRRDHAPEPAGHRRRRDAHASSRRAPQPPRRDPARELRGPADRGLLHAGHLLQALLLLHLPGHRARPARHRDRRRAGGRVPARSATRAPTPSCCGASCSAGWACSRAIWWWRSSRSTPLPSGTTDRAARRPRAWGCCSRICVLVFAPFVAPGVIIATLFGRRPEGVGSLYFADLVGAGLACASSIYLTGTIGPPATIMLAGAVMFFGAGDRAGHAPARWRCRWRSCSWPGWSSSSVDAQHPARPASRHDQGRSSCGDKPDLLGVEPDLPRRRRADGPRRPVALSRRHPRLRHLPLERQCGVAGALRLRRRPRADPLRRAEYPAQDTRRSSAPPAGTRCWRRCGSGPSTSTPSSSIPSRTPW